MSINEFIKYGFDETDFVRLDRVRNHLKVLYISDITKVNGKRIKFSIFNELQDQSTKVQYKWRREESAPSHFKEQFERRGSGLETRNAVHISCPLSPMERSGLFLIGKWSKRQGAEDGYLCMTAFRVPQFHAIYIPEGTIHSDDFLQGSWKTILPKTAKEINRVRICAESSTYIKEGEYLFQQTFCY